jgi:predicted transcriptional regulator
VPIFDFVIYRLYKYPQEFSYIWGLFYMADDLDAKISQEEVLRMAAEIVSAYVSRNALASDQIPGLIKSVHGSLARLQNGDAAVGRATPKPAVPIRRSVTPDYIVCLEDGKQLKMLKRHLRTTYKLTPEEYRVKWGLPADYPMVAPNYAAQRSAFAKKIGLGRKGRGDGKGRAKGK